MNISEFAPYFHDGTIFSIKQNGSSIEIYMQSSELDKEVGTTNSLSKYHRLAGKLHLDGIKKIRDNNKDLIHGLTMKYQSACILNLEVKNGKLILDIEWKNYPPNPDKTEYSFYEVQAEKIWWENIPELPELYKN